MIYLKETEKNIMVIDSTFWVAVSFVIFFGGLIYLKVPHKINDILNKLISDMSNKPNISIFIYSEQTYDHAVVFITLRDEEDLFYMVAVPLFNTIYTATDIHDLVIELPYYTWAKITVTRAPEDEQFPRYPRMVSTSKVRMFDSQYSWRDTTPR